MKKNIMKKKIEPTPEWLITVLTTGEWPKAGEDGCFERFTRKLAKEWVLHKQEIMPGWITERSCTRPYGWWIFESPEPRKRVKGTAIEKEHHEPMAYYYGVPENDTFFDLGIDKESIKESDFETQAEYLERLGLLTKDEKKLLNLQKCK